MACAMVACSAAPSGIRILSFQPEQPLGRARRPAGVEAVLENTGEAAAMVRAELVLPDGLRLVQGKADTTVRIEGSAGYLKRKRPGLATSGSSSSGRARRRPPKRCRCGFCPRWSGAS
jgi:hypothetical protein